MGLILTVIVFVVAISAIGGWVLATIEKKNNDKL